MGRIVAHLKATGEYQHTLIVFTCDHGEMGGDHYTWGKELYFDQSFHIDPIVRSLLDTDFYKLLSRYGVDNGRPGSRADSTDDSSYSPLP